jgi:hypothetical protein
MSRTTGTILEAVGYSKQSNQKMLQAGEPRPGWDFQFGYINATAKRFISEDEPVISIDTKKSRQLQERRAGIPVKEGSRKSPVP